MNIDEELKIALRREEPPEGFAERVLARLPERVAPETASNVVPFRPRRSTTILSGIAAAALLGAFGSLAFMLPRAAEPARTANVVPAPQPDVAPTEPPPVASATAPPTGNLPVVAPVKYTRPRPKPRPEQPAVDEEGERATQQLLLALRVTGDKLATVKESLRENLRESLVDRRAR